MWYKVSFFFPLRAISFQYFFLFVKKLTFRWDVSFRCLCKFNFTVKTKTEHPKCLVRTEGEHVCEKKGQHFNTTVLESCLFSLISLLYIILMAAIFHYHLFLMWWKCIGFTFKIQKVSQKTTQHNTILPCRKIYFYKCKCFIWFHFQAGGADKQKQGPRESGLNLFHCLTSRVITSNHKNKKFFERKRHHPVFFYLFILFLQLDRNDLSVCSFLKYMWTSSCFLLFIYFISPVR